MPSASCKICEKKFYARPSFLKMGWAKFCSKKCQYLGFRTGKKFNCDFCGKQLYRALSKLNHSKSGKYFCGKSCQTQWRNRHFIGELHRNWKGGASTYRDILERIASPKLCLCCKEKDVRVLAVHHVDGNHGNNDVNNLVWLCHNCHQLVHRDSVERKKLNKEIEKERYGALSLMVKL